MQRNAFAKLISAMAMFVPALAGADTGIYATASTLGFGGGIGYDITDSISARLGYLMLNFEANVHTDELDYDGASNWAACKERWIGIRLIMVFGFRAALFLVAIKFNSMAFSIKFKPSMVSITV